MNFAKFLLISLLTDCLLITKTWECFYTKSSCVCPTSIVSYVNLVVPKLEDGNTWRPSRASVGGDVIHGENYISGAMIEKFESHCFKFCLHRKRKCSELRNVYNKYFLQFILLYP